MVAGFFLIINGEIKMDEYEYAGFWIRVWASLIDLILFLIITIPFMLLIYGKTGYELDMESKDMFLGAADFLINYTLPFIGTVLLWFYKSATPGKMALNIKIVDADNGGKLSVGQVMGRYVAYLPATLVFLIGIIWVAFDKRKQGWHDKLARTVVIRKKKNSSVEKVEFKYN